MSAEVIGLATGRPITVRPSRRAQGFPYRRLARALAVLEARDPDAIRVLEKIADGCAGLRWYDYGRSQWVYEWDKR
jgi:hypothetical protein